MKGEHCVIPKIIHYCWFGHAPKTEQIKSYIATWKKNCPDYRIVEWNEENFDINENQYCREAYEAKKWAFVTDYVRLKVLFTHGGIYMDTDVEVVKPLDALLAYAAFSGYESMPYISTGIMGAEKHNSWIAALLREYETIHFVKPDGSYDLTTNVHRITNWTKKLYNTTFNGKMRILDGNIAIFPFEYLCAKSFQTGELFKSNETYAIHHFAGSWLSEEAVREKELYQKNYLSLRAYIPIECLASGMARLISTYKVYGAKITVKKIIRFLT